jgi:4-hydroxy-3-methylbut-2-enyl diphosphate reductase
VLLARPRGFCAGVDRAIDIVELALRKHGAPVYVRKEIVHNPHVVAGLRAKGAVFVESEEDVPEGAVVIFSAHGVSPEVRRRAEARGLTAIDATCPLVTKVHLEARRYLREGYSILLIGHPGHDEIVGTLGEAPDAIALVPDIGAAEAVQVAHPERVVCLTQTTLSLDDTQDIVAALRRRFPGIVVRNDICYATQNRQAAVKDLARRVEAVLVVGAANSSNSVRLMEVARAQGVAAYRIGDAAEMDAAWVKGKRTVAVTSGASTPEVKVAEVVERLRALGLGGAREVAVLEEHVTFALPKELMGARDGAVE